MKFYWLLLGSLAVWRITTFLHAEDGPWAIGVRLRRLAGAGVFGKVLDCYYCLSVWVALPLALLLGEGWLERCLLWPALSGAAILLARLTGVPLRPEQPPTYFEDPEPSHVLLRPTETTPQSPPEP